MCVYIYIYIYVYIYMHLSLKDMLQYGYHLSMIYSLYECELICDKSFFVSVSLSKWLSEKKYMSCHFLQV